MRKPSLPDRSSRSPFEPESFEPESFEPESFEPESFTVDSFAAGSSVGGTPVEEPPAATSPPVPREVAIAEVLRAALAEGHSDDALAGILRRVVAGDAPQTPPVEPAVDELPAPVAPEAPAPVPADLPANTDLFGPLPSAQAAAPAAGPAPAAAPSASVGLWGEVSPAPAPTSSTVEPEAPIWAEVRQTRPVAPADEPVAEPSLFGTQAAASAAPASPEQDETDTPALEVPADASATAEDTDEVGTVDAETTEPETAERRPPSPRPPSPRPSRRPPAPTSTWRSRPHWPAQPATPRPSAGR